MADDRPWTSPDEPPEEAPPDESRAKKIAHISEKYSGLYGADYLKRLRDDWPE